MVLRKFLGAALFLSLILPAKPSIAAGFGVGLTYNSISYNQTNLAAFHETTLRAEAEIDFLQKSKRFELGVRGSLDVLPLNTSVTGTSARFMNTEVRLGPCFPASRFTRFALLGGYQYQRTVSTQGGSLAKVNKVPWVWLQITW
jgi:hypothetical protein